MSIEKQHLKRNSKIETQHTKPKINKILLDPSKNKNRSQVTTLEAWIICKTDAEWNKLTKPAGFVWIFSRNGFTTPSKDRAPKTSSTPLPWQNH